MGSALGAGGGVSSGAELGAGGGTSIRGRGWDQHLGQRAGSAVGQN